MSSACRGVLTVHHRERPLFARKIRVEIIEPQGSRACPVAWLDSFCMRNFTGRSAFDETLPLEDGEMEAGFGVELDALRINLENWLTRKFGGGQPVKVRLTEKQVPSAPA